MTRYLLARYVDDLTRNEPVNVGVIAYDGSQTIARFDGENDEGHIDLRRVRHRITGSNTYRAWVNYWRRALTEPQAVFPDAAALGRREILDRLVQRGGDEFTLIPGGEILLDADARDLQTTLDGLFERLVRAPEPLAAPTLTQKSRHALAHAGVPLDNAERFVETPEITIEVQGVRVLEEMSYKVLNGSWHHLQEAPLDPGRPRTSRKEASHVAFLFEHAVDVEHGIVLYDGTDLNANSRPLIDVIGKFATTVDVADPDQAADVLRTEMSLHDA